MKTSASTAGADAHAARVRAAFTEEEYQGLRLATRVRVVAIAVITVWITFENGFPRVLFFYPPMAGFALLGIVPLWLRRAGLAASWQRYVFLLLDVSLLSATVLVHNPLDPDAFPAPMRLRIGNEIYLTIFLTAALFSYSPRLVLWAGFCVAGVWTVGTLWIVSLPATRTAIPPEQWAAMTPEQRIAAVVDPHHVTLNTLEREIVVFLVVAGILATFVRRTRRLVMRQAEAERERANLSRYFSPNMVEELARSDEPLRATRHQNVAVLFIDIVGFTTVSATQPPDQVIQFLRDFHRLMARAVFDHNGTVDKYLGDGLMVTFGTPRTGDRDATNALHCARSMVQQIAAWNAERAQRGQAPVRIGVGAHYGPVVLGDIGDEQHLEFAVLGDTVNVASRLQELTRATGVQALLSDDLLAAVRHEGVMDAAGLHGVEQLAAQPIRGREGLLGVWTLR
jgi:adenylate cyclase